MRLYEKYHYVFWGWLFFELILPWFVGFMITLVFILRLIDGTLEYRLFLLLLAIAWGLYQGLYQHSITTITISLWNIYLTEKGIYGKKFYQTLLFFRKPELMAEWEEIDNVIYKQNRFNNNMGCIQVIKKNGKKFRISYFGYMPLRWKDYYQTKILAGSNRGIVSEMAGIIAWKIGIDKMVNFPVNEGLTDLNKRKNLLSVENMQKVKEEIESGIIIFDETINL